MNLQPEKQVLEEIVTAVREQKPVFVAIEGGKVKPIMDACDVST